jgi:hypothetical protein
MKTLYAVIVVAFLLATSVYSQVAQRMITDYRGVATNGRTVVAYGDYGIITTTRDYGKTWSQTSIGDKHKIKRIFSIGNDFIGVTDHTLIKSTDDGKTWEKAPEPFESPEIVDVALQGNTLYVLTLYAVWTADMDMQLSPQPVMEIQDGSTITVDGENLYIVTNFTFLTHYSLSLKTSTVSEITKKLNPNSLGRYVSDVRVIGNTLYALLNDNKGESFGYLEHLIYSGDSGQTWSYNAYNLQEGNTYLSKDGKMYFRRANQTSGIYSAYYYRLDSTDNTMWRSYFTVINDKDTPERNIAPAPNGYTGIATIGRDTMIAVGMNKLISISYDGGRLWQLRSFFSANQTPYYYDYSHFIDARRGYHIQGGAVFATSDSGTTWLTQKIIKGRPGIKNDIVGYFFTDDGRGVLRTNTQKPTDSNVIVTNDYGDTYTLYDSNSLFNYNKFEPAFQKGLKAGSSILYVPAKTNTALNVRIMRYDDKFRFRDTVLLNVNVIESIDATPDGNLYILALRTSGENKADSLGNSDYSYSYFMLKSGDEGKTWDSLPIPIPIRQEFGYHAGYKAYRFTDRLSGSYGTVEGDHIFYPLSKGLMYRFNYKTLMFDSIVAPSGIRVDRGLMFRLGERFYTVQHDSLFYTDVKDLASPAPEWSGIRLADMLESWQPPGSGQQPFGKDFVLSVQAVNDSTAIMVTGVARPYFGLGYDFKTNIVRLTLTSTSTSISETTTANNRVYLWNSPPYPLPGKSIIASRIYWNNQYNIANITIAVYDMSGMLLPEQKISIDKQQDYKGLLLWDCSAVPDWVYMIKITLGEETLSFPVMVAK